jgi:hypothetical protein
MQIQQTVVVKLRPFFQGNIKGKVITHDRWIELTLTTLVCSLRVKVKEEIFHSTTGFCERLSFSGVYPLELYKEGFLYPFLKAIGNCTLTGELAKDILVQAFVACGEYKHVLETFFPDYSQEVREKAVKEITRELSNENSADNSF